MKTTSIKELYAYAIVEGEGVGTAYEYFAKRRILEPVLSHARAGDEVLIAGLPEKYGTSLDFVLAAHARGCACIVVDERQDALDKAQQAITAAQSTGLLTSARVRYRKIASLGDLASVPPAAVALSCEVLQRVPAPEQRAFTAALCSRAPRGALFVPNSENDSHLKISGLGGFTRASLADAMTARDAPRVEIGFTDMPPFPPGITRTAEQRTRASTGALEAIAMRGLEVYCRAEPLVPAQVKRNFAHIVWARWGI